MINDGNGTCYDKTTYRTFIAQHEDKYVMEVKEGGSATDTSPISACTSTHRELSKFQELENKGGYIAKESKSSSSTLNISNIILIMIIFSIFSTN